MNTIEKIEDILINLGFKLEKQIDGQFVSLSFSENDSAKIPIPICITQYPDISDSDVSLIQFYFEYKLKIDEFSEIDINSKVLLKNKELLYGSFNLQNDTIYYKYVMICKKENIDQSNLFHIISLMDDTIMNVVDKDFI